MKNGSTKFIAVATILCLVSGCATIQDDSTRTKAEGTGTGAVGGAVVGAVIGAIIGGRKGAAAGAGIGAVLGGAAGYSYGSTVAERKLKYANDEDRLNGEIAAVAKENSDLKEFNLIAVTQIQNMRREVASLKEQQRTGKIQVGLLDEKQNEMNAILEENKKRRDYYNKELIALNEYHKAIEQSNNQADIVKLNTEISILREQIATLDKNNAQMAQLVSSLTVSK